MNRSLSYLIGEHDFTSFKSAKATSPAKDCIVYKAECTKNGDFITIEIAKTNRFFIQYGQINCRNSAYDRA